MDEPGTNARAFGREYRRAGLVSGKGTFWVGFRLIDSGIRGAIEHDVASAQRRADSHGVGDIERAAFEGTSLGDQTGQFAAHLAAGTGHNETGSEVGSGRYSRVHAAKSGTPDSNGWAPATLPLVSLPRGVGAENGRTGRRNCSGGFRNRERTFR